jgi:hypothetical protein
MKWRRPASPIGIGHEGFPVPIVSDAAVATTNVRDGRLIPVLILDTSDREDIGDLIRLHRRFGQGDVTVQWGKIDDKTENVALFLSFKRPVEAVCILKFDVDKQGGLIDAILLTNSLQLQSSIYGSRFIAALDAPRIIIEIPDTGFSKEWAEISFKSYVRRFRSAGLTRTKAKLAAREAIGKWQEIISLRMP